MHVSGVFFFLFATAVAAQIAGQSSQSSYDGQNVAEIDLIANPHRDVEPLRSLVSQKTGQPYSQAKVEASITALEGTGQFPNIQVKVIPDLSGLRLNFLLESAYFLGMVNFPGAVKAFSYTRLLQTVNLPDEEPYDKSRVAVAEKALQDFLHHNGYFQSTIQSDSEIVNTAKFVVIHELEEQLPVALFRHEWHVCGHGKDKDKYVPLTHLERWIPWMFGGLYVVLLVMLSSFRHGRKPQLRPQQQHRSLSRRTTD